MRENETRLKRPLSPSTIGRVAEVDRFGAAIFSVTAMTETAARAWAARGRSATRLQDRLPPPAIDFERMREHAEEEVE